jgi:hypothetical protein
MTEQQPFDPLEVMLEQLARLQRQRMALPDLSTPRGRATFEFFENNWATARDGLLSKTEIIRVRPWTAEAPTIFDFEIDAPYKRRLRPGEPVELMPGPIRGQIHYRANLLEQPGPSIAVPLDPALGFFHSNFSRRFNLVCLGGELPSLFYLDALLEYHLYPILTYQNIHPAHPADPDATLYFAFDPEAMQGLQPAKPLY